jgi:hypothetical protein
MTLPIRAVGDVSDAELRALQSELASVGLLADAVAWAARRTPPAHVAEVVIQDEYTHDVVLDLGGGRWAALDAT